MIPRWAHAVGVLVIAASHTWLYITLFGYGFTAGVAGRDVTALGIAVNALGTPLMHLLYLGPNVFGRWGRWWGDDSNLIIGLAVLNGLVWGLGLMWLLTKWMRQKTHAA